MCIRSRSPHTARRGLTRRTSEALTLISLLASLDELRETFHINEAVGYVMTPSWTTMALAAKSAVGLANYLRLHG